MNASSSEDPLSVRGTSSPRMDRTEAMEWARDLDLPLLAIRTTVARVTDGAMLSHKLSLTVDVVDAKAEGLKVLKHATDNRNVLKGDKPVVGDLGI